ncbi:MAG: pseudouridine synthase [Gammaproteobacteria bacterium]|nr:pseudouridine synthase [Gammaproteobacteria bacterium]
MRKPGPRQSPPKQRPPRQRSTASSRLILFNKPFGVLCQFRPANDTPTLADYIDAPGFYPAGRLDKDSEGLLVLTNDGRLQHRIAHPDKKLPKTYLVQVDGDIDATAIRQLTDGVLLKDGPTLPASVRKLDPPPAIDERDPPIRKRLHIPTSWLEITLREGRNRQVRRMTAACGFPTLRLIRVAVGDWTLGTLKAGQWQFRDTHLPARTSGPPQRSRRFAQRKKPQ